MSLKNATELCCLLVKEVYGEISAKIVEILLIKGRQPFHQLLRNAKLPDKTVRETLVVLIQQHLIQHHTQKDGAREVTYYESNWSQIYHLLHAGRAIRWVEERYGADAALIISNFLQLGHARVSDFLAAYGQNVSKASKHAAANGVDGTSGAIVSVDTLRTTLQELVKAKILIQVRPHHMQPAADVENEIKQKLRKEFAAQTTVESKIVKQIDNEWKSRLRQLDDAPVPTAAITSTAAGKKRKEPPAETKAPAKRRKQAQTAFVNTSLDNEITVGLDESIALRVNYEKFLVFFRNQELIALAEKKISKVTAQVYGELLKIMESKVHRCRYDADIEENEYKKHKVSTLEIFKNFPDTIKLDDSIAPMPKSKSEEKSRKRKRKDDDSEVDEDDEEDDEDEKDSDGDEDSDEDGGADAATKRKKMTLIKEHLQLLAQGTIKFVNFESSKGMGEWSVNYKELARFLRQNEFEKIVYERFGPQSTRLIRIVDDKGKLDEKQLANLALIRQKDIRSKLLCLHDAGHLSIQEIAKTAERHPARTIYLWFFDREKSHGLVLHDIYKAISRGVERLAKERQERAPLLAKLNRTDVIGNEEVFLTKGEKSEVQRWKEIETHIWAQIGRMDRQVMIFKDF